MVENAFLDQNIFLTKNDFYSGVSPLPNKGGELQFFQQNIFVCKSLKMNKKMAGNSFSE
jgi:hypothetical protein